MLKNLVPCLGLTAISTVLGSTDAGLATGAAVAAGGVLVNIASNFLQPIAHQQSKEIIERYITGWRGVDGNHRIYQTLRRAQLNALRRVVTQYEQQWDEDSKDDVRKVSPPTDAIRAFLKAEFDASENLKFLAGGGSAEQDGSTRVASLKNLSATFGSTLAARQPDKISKDDIEEMAHNFKAIAEKAVLEELRQACFKEEVLSEGLLDSFYGQGPYQESWHDLFIRDFSAKIRDEQDVAHIWQAEQQATVKALAGIHTQLLHEIKETGKDTNTVVHDMNPKMDSANAMLAQLIAESRDSAREFGIKEGMLIALAQRYAEGSPGDFDAALRGLEQALEVARDERERGRLPSNLSKAVDAVIARIDALNETGDLDAGQAVLDEELAALDAEDERRRAERARLYDKGIAQAVLTRSVAHACRFVLARFDLDAPQDPAQRFNALRSEQDDWYVSGRDKGLNLDLEIAIDLAKISQARASDANERGAALNDLGITLQTLGERESGVGRLEAAVAAYREALKEYTRERVPLDWAMTQMNLGNALATLGTRESGTARLEAAVAAYREALKERTHERLPLGWAMTQMNLGITLSTLGTRESGTERLEAAVAAYREALEEQTRERVPREWAMTQMNLGNALATLGTRESGTARLEAAVAAYREALKEYTRERVPLDWAMTQMNLGNAFRILGARESGVRRLEAAVAAYDEALKENTRERVPLAWAGTVGNRTVAQIVIAERTGDLALARAALADLELAARVSREGGHVPNAEIQESEIVKAREVVARLGG